MLVADEVARREHKKFNLRIRGAGFRSSKTLEQFDFNPAIDQTLIAELATCRFVAEKIAVLNRLLGAATLDRLRHCAYRLTPEGESYRFPTPMPAPRKSTVATGGK